MIPKKHVLSFKCNDLFKMANLKAISSSATLSREWRCSWSSTDRRCSNYISVINNFIAIKVHLILEVWGFIQHDYVVAGTLSTLSNLGRGAPSMRCGSPQNRPIMRRFVLFLLFAWTCWTAAAVITDAITLRRHHCNGMKYLIKSCPEIASFKSAKQQGWGNTVISKDSVFRLYIALWSKALWERHINVDQGAVNGRIVSGTM